MYREVLILYREVRFIVPGSVTLPSECVPHMRWG